MCNWSQLLLLAVLGKVGILDRIGILNCRERRNLWLLKL